MNRIGIVVMVLGMCGGIAWSQEARPGAATTTTAATRPLLTDIEAALGKEVAEFDADELPLKDVIALLRDKGNMNVVANWPALEAAGVKRDVPVTLRLRKVPAEQIVRAICEVVTAKDTRLNYTAGEGAVEITTNEQLASETLTRLVDLSKLLGMELSPKPAAATRPRATTRTATTTAPADKAREARADELLALMRAELARIGERAEGKDRELLIKSDTLAAVQSRRGMMGVARILQAMDSPLKPGAVPTGVVASVRQKKAEAEMAALIKKQPSELYALQGIAEEHAKWEPDLNVIVLSGTILHADVDPSQKLDYQVSDAGLVFIGPAATIHARTVPAVYDLREIIKRMSLKPENKGVSAAELSARIVANLKKNALPELWSDLGKGPCTMTEYEGLVVIFAPPAVYRLIGDAWKDVEK